MIIMQIIYGKTNKNNINVVRGWLKGIVKYKKLYYNEYEMSQRTKIIRKKWSVRL